MPFLKCISFTAVSLLFMALSTLNVWADNSPTSNSISPLTALSSPTPPPGLQAACVEQLKKIPGNIPEAEIKNTCANVQKLDSCQSVQGRPIYHFERKGSNKAPKRILAKALIHGDEFNAGSVARAWMMRLQKIEPRNTWRVIPIANPDGWAARTRTNSNGVDLNRNFPTQNWETQALNHWRQQMKSDPRRYPGTKPSSEPETQCILKEIDDFKPDFIISIHTPLGVLDLDGPKVKNPPAFKPLPWLSLGNFPGSLGRYMWVDRKTPVLTIELKSTTGVKNLEDFDQLQDISGTIAIQADRLKKSATSPKPSPTPASTP